MDPESRDAFLVSEMTECARKAGALWLNHDTTGNVSVRCDAGMSISCSGSSCATLADIHMVLVTPFGLEGPENLRPSSEYPFHHAIYEARPDVHAIIHCHSYAATVVATDGVNLPIDFHYMALALKADVRDGIRCAPFEIPGSDALATATVQALGGANACLLGNHGQVAVGRTPRGALSNAIILEELCRYYIASYPLRSPKRIPADKLEALIALFPHYRG